MPFWIENLIYNLLNTASGTGKKIYIPIFKGATYTPLIHREERSHQYLRLTQDHDISVHEALVRNSRLQAMEIIPAFVSGVTLLFLGSLNSATDYTESLQHEVSYTML